MRRRAYLLAASGGLAWLAYAGWNLFAGRLIGPLALIEVLLDFAMLVHVPLLLGLMCAPDRNGRTAWPLRAALALWPLAAPLAVFSSPYTLPLVTRTAGVLLALPYVLLTLLMFACGLGRWLARGRGLPGPLRPSDTALDAGLMYVAVGGVWLLFDRAGLTLGFPAIIVLLTAVHFHFAGLAVPMLAGFAGRGVHANFPHPGARLRRVYAPVAVILICGPLLVALGIAFSPLMEVICAVILALGALGLGWIQTRLALRLRSTGTREILSTFLLVLSALLLICSMTFAVLFAYGEYAGVVIVDITGMLLPHGIVNTVAVFAAILAHVLVPPASGLPVSGIPFSRLRSGGRVGADFLERAGLLEERNPAPHGLTDDLGAYRHEALEPDRIAPDVRAFYERTDEFELIVVPNWHPAFRGGARLYKRISTFMGQMNFPSPGESVETRMDSRIEAVRDSADGRAGVRAWTRRYHSTGQPIYVAAYSTHAYAGEPYMNIAFPYFAGNLSSILRLEELPASSASGSGVLLTTLPRDPRSPRAVGDEGVYFATPLLPVRLPINETIRVWPADAKGLPFTPEYPGPAGRVLVTARHDMWLFGFPFLYLDYYIFRKSS